MDALDLIPQLWQLLAGLFVGAWAFLISGYGLALLLLPRILSEQRTAGGAWAWLLVVFLIPHAGVVLYLLFGGRHLRTIERIYPNLSVPLLPAPPLEGAQAAASVHLARHGGAPVLAATGVQIIGDGVRAYEAVIAMLGAAERSIDVSIFILYQDEVGQAVVDLLAQKARDGVRVRLLIDAGGMLLGLKRPGDLLRLRSFTAPIREAGGEVATFLPMLPRKRAWSVNMRNHRKVIIVDDARAMLGGMNLGAEYMGPEPDPGRWRDLIAVLEGPVLAAIQTLFEEDWHIATGSHRECPPYSDEVSGVPVQILADGPAFYDDAFAKLIQVALHQARRRVAIITPYFVPDQALQAALIATAHAGVRVELLVPARSNHRSADWARRPFLRELIAEGVAVLAYQPGMVHAKCAVIDEELAWISSANLDMRSITLNFEIAAVFYDGRCARTIQDYFDELAADTLPLSPGDLSSRGIRAVGESLLRLLSPMI